MHDVLWPINLPWAIAFQTLSRGRGIGVNGALPLTYREIAEYAKDHGFADTLTDLDEFVMIMQSMDDALLEHLKPKTNK